MMTLDDAASSDAIAPADAAPKRHARKVQALSLRYPLDAQIHPICLHL